MRLPIIERLKDGVTFDFETLADNDDQTEEFWNWWWQEKAGDFRTIVRPEILDSEDLILTNTLEKPIADFRHHPEYFDRHLVRALQTGWLPQGQCSREAFREQIKQLLRGCSVKLPEQPQLIFSGGGYGSGKTSMLQMLAASNRLPVSMSHLVGVDNFKHFVPEYNLIKGVGDGRASAIAQDECRLLASELYEDLVNDCHSFIWDSSMSDFGATLEKIELAKSRGYHLTLIAVLTPQEIAIEQAMRRALNSRRFPNPLYLPKSHTDFKRSLLKYVPYFEEITVFANRIDFDDACFVVAEKLLGSSDLTVYDHDYFRRALAA